MKTTIDFISKLQKELQQPLPGEDAQYRMAPSYRPRIDWEEISQLNPKLSGVLVLLYFKNKILHLVLTKRRTYPGVHSGQMSFPGGRKDETDLTLTQTALRETEEEIGVPQSKIEVIGSLSKLYIPPSNFIVQPSVGFLNQEVSFIPDPVEVEKIIELPIDFFLNRKNINMKTEISIGQGQKVTVPAYIYQENVIWGATAIMLSEFTYIVEKAI